jgi:hypothetical protein
MSNIDRVHSNLSGNVSAHMHAIDTDDAQRGLTASVAGSA